MRRKSPGGPNAGGPNVGEPEEELRWRDAASTPRAWRRRARQHSRRVEPEQKHRRWPRRPAVG